MTPSENAHEVSRLEVFYDGACHLCSREIEHYRKIDREGALRLVDISLPTFDAGSLGVDPVQVQKEMHVRRGHEIFVGVPAFMEIWKCFPGYRSLVPFAQSPLIMPILNVGYWAFAKIRPLLPRRKVDSCDTGTCAR
ncbi:MAG: DUF393 domain-containing protein [Methylotenera sp.]|nr:DUF393 domain-containing protein [Oligoflexia bacterium]